MVSQQPAPRLSPDLWQALHGIRTVRVYSRGAQLFRQGDSVKGMYVVESGDVRVLLSSGSSGQQLLEIIGAGAVLGLIESMSGDDHRVTAEAATHTTVAFIPRDVFLDFLRDRCDYCLQIVRLLSEDLHALYHKFRSISAHPGRPRHRSLDEQLN